MCAFLSCLHIFFVWVDSIHARERDESSLCIQCSPVFQSKMEGLKRLYDTFGDSGCFSDVT